jgi:Ni,Fe-hydrogenase III large subunit/Ni,Fe-hydrogenase III component G
MSMHDLLSNLPSVTVKPGNGTYTEARVAPEQFTAALDELVNCRTLAQATYALGIEEAGALYSQGLSLANMYATDDRPEEGTFGIHALLHDDTTQSWLILSTSVNAQVPEYPSATRFIMAAQWYERYIFDMLGIMPVGHPDLRRLVHHENMPLETYPLRRDFPKEYVPENDNVAFPMLQVAGEGVYEVGVGPVYNRVAESIHFRLNSTGERIMTFEAKPFFKHKGVEKIVEGMGIKDALPYFERIGSEAAVSHALAFAEAIESIDKTDVSLRVRALRSLLNEIERVILHIEDLSNIAAIGAGYTAMKRGFSIKEKLMRLSDELCGNRFFKGLIVPGGLSRDFTDEEIERTRKIIVEAIDEIHLITTKALRSDGLRDRLETTGVLKKEAALVYGAVGIVARASGVDRDVRRDHPYAAYDRFQPRVMTSVAGDVYARFKLRLDELLESRRLIIDITSHIGEGPIKVPCHPEAGMGVAAVEGARGETVYVVSLKDGVIQKIAIRDASFMNWPLLHEMIPTNVLSDFPLCARSLGLSVAGNDL